MRGQYVEHNLEITTKRQLFDELSLSCVSSQQHSLKIYR